MRALASLWMNGSEWEDGWMDGKPCWTKWQLHYPHVAPQYDEDESSDWSWSLMTGVWSPPANWTKPNMSIRQIGHLHIYCSCISCCRAKRTMVSLYWIVKGILNSSMVLFHSERIAHSCFIVSFLQEDVLLSWLKVSKRMGCFMCHDGQSSVPLN